MVQKVWVGVVLVVVVCMALTTVEAAGRNVGFKHRPLTNLKAVPNVLSKAKWAPHIANVPLGGNIQPLGIYYFDVEVGTPPRSFKVALDTGSSDLVIPARGCVGCHVDNATAYDPSASTTNKQIGCGSTPYCPAAKCYKTLCGFSNTYQTCNLSDPTQPCTVSGPVYSDEVTLSGLKTRVVFGAIANQTANFQQFYVIDGVIGFAGRTTIGTMTTFDLLFKEGDLEDDVFSICLNYPYAYPHSGVITLGGIDPKLHTDEVRWTKNIDTAYYTIAMTTIKVGGKDIKVPWENHVNTIIDSGTNILLLNTPTFTALKTYFRDNYCSGNPLVGICSFNASNTLFDGLCFEMTEAQINAFPAIDLVIQENIPLTVKAADYLLLDQNTAAKENKKYCLGILPTGPQGFTIIGDIIMQNYYFVFDLGKARIGFATVNRDNCLASAGF